MFACPRNNRRVVHIIKSDHQVESIIGPQYHRLFPAMVEVNNKVYFISGILRAWTIFFPNCEL